MSTEGIGISEINRILERNNLLEPEILKNDRTISWDGKISVFDDKAKNKRHLYGIINLQVKTTIVNEFSTSGTSYPFDVHDLRNYKNNGGVVLFFVEALKNSIESKIYYKFLLPVDLQLIFENTISEGQQTKRIEFLETLTFDNCWLFESKCLNFVNDSKRQISTYEIKLDKTNAILKHFGIIVPTDKFEEYLLTQTHPVYGKQIRQGMDIFIGYEKFNSLKFTIKSEISVNGKEYYTGFDRIVSNNGDEIKFGKGIFANLKTNKVRFSFTGNLYEQLLDNQFLYDAITHEKITISDGYMEIKDDKPGELQKMLRNNIKHLKETETMLLCLGIEPEKLDYSEITLNQLPTLQFLIAAFVHKQIFIEKPFEAYMSSLEIGNLLIGVFMRKEDDGYLIDNLFNLPTRVLTKELMNDSERFPSSIYLSLDSESLIKLSNLNLENVFIDIKNVEFSPVFASSVNGFCLELLKAFDQTKRTEFIQKAEEILSWLISNNYDEDFVKINLLQTNNRSRPLLDTENNWLIDIESKYRDNYMMFCAISILLGNNGNALFSLQKMTIDDLGVFKKFPIYQLGVIKGIFKD